MSTSIRVLLTDDHAVVRSGLRRLLEQHEGIRVVAEAESGEQAYQLFGEVKPDVVVMDMSMPGMGGLEALRRILARYQNANIVVFSMHENTTFVTQAMAAGAVGYVTKSGEADDLVSAVRAGAEGKRYLSSTMAHNIALQSTNGDDNPVQKLTVREFEVFRLLVEGNTTEEVSNILRIGQKTVANHQTLLRQKLGVSSPVELVRLAIKHGVIESN